MNPKPVISSAGGWQGILISAAVSLVPKAWSAWRAKRKREAPMRKAAREQRRMRKADEKEAKQAAKNARIAAEFDAARKAEYLEAEAKRKAEGE